jgi:hypothetical protein
MVQRIKKHISARQVVGAIVGMWFLLILFSPIVAAIGYITDEQPVANLQK